MGLVPGSSTPGRMVPGYAVPGFARTNFGEVVTPVPSSSPYNFDGRSVNQEIDGNLVIKSSIGTDGNLSVAGTSTLTGNSTVGGTLGVTGVLTATDGVVGAVTGGVTGNVTGNLTGNVTSSGTSVFAATTQTGLTNGIVEEVEGSPSINGYAAWNYPIFLASSAITLTTTDVYGARFVAPYTFTPTYMDVYCTNMNSGTVTLAEAAMFAAAGAGGTALFAAPDIHTAWQTAGVAKQTWTWTTPTALVAGTTYVVMILTTATTSGPSISAIPTVAGLNVNLGAGLGNYFTYGTAASLTTASTYTLASGTNSGTTPFWFGLR